MKKLIVALIVLTPFIGVGQDNRINVILSNGDTLIGRAILNRWDSLSHSHSLRIIRINDSSSSFISADTLSAYLLITTRHMGIAYQKRGFVVYNRLQNSIAIKESYLDCNKREIKPPITVWKYQIINQPK